MTPVEKLHNSQRVWTPRLLSANTILQAGAIVLWFFVSSWVLDIKTSVNKNNDSIDNIKVVMSERSTAAAIWRQSTTDRIGFIDDRLVKVEKQVYKQ